MWKITECGSPCLLRARLIIFIYICTCTWFLWPLEFFFETWREEISVFSLRSVWFPRAFSSRALPCRVTSWCPCTMSGVLQFPTLQCSGPWLRSWSSRSLLLQTWTRLFLKVRVTYPEGGPSLYSVLHEVATLEVKLWITDQTFRLILCLVQIHGELLGPISEGSKASKQLYLSEYLRSIQFIMLKVELIYTERKLLRK